MREGVCGWNRRFGLPRPRGLRLCGRRVCGALFDLRRQAGPPYVARCRRPAFLDPWAPWRRLGSPRGHRRLRCGLPRRQRRRLGHTRRRGASSRVVVGGLHRENEVCDVDLVALLEWVGRRDLPAVDPGAVRGVEIHDDRLVVLQRKSRVLLRHVALREHDVVALNAPDSQLRLREIEPSPRAPLIGDHHRVHIARFIQRRVSRPVK